MKDQTPLTVALVAGFLIAGGFAIWLVIRSQNEAELVASREQHSTTLSAMAERAKAKAETAAEQAVLASAQLEAKGKLKAELQRRLDQKDARSHEAVLTFKSEDAYRKFLARAVQAGLKLRGQIDSLRTVRVGYD